MSDTEKSILETRWTLVRRLKDLDDSGSWQTFYDTYSRLIFAVCLKAGLSTAEAEEALQESVIEVAKKIGDFRADPNAGSFRGWLLLITRWKIGDQFKKRRKGGNQMQIHESTPLAEESVHPEADSSLDHFEALWDKEWILRRMSIALEKVKRKCKAKHFQIFQLLLDGENSPREVARAVGVGVAQVYLIRHRLNRILKKEIMSLGDDI